MDIERFQELKDRIVELKEKKAKAEGLIENIILNWKKDFSIGSLEEAESKEKELEQKIKVCEERMEKYLGKIESAVDWDNV